MQLLSACGLTSGLHTMSAIVTVESAGNLNAIHDNTTGRSYYPAVTSDAVALAITLVNAGHSVDLGLAQINSGNLPGLGLSVASMFDPCVNLRTGASILTGDYARSLRRFGPGMYAALRAIGAYNTGRLTQGDPYIRKVLDAYTPGAPLPPPRLPAPIAVREQTAPASPRPKKKKAPAPDPASAPVLVQLGGMHPK